MVSGTESRPAARARNGTRREEILDAAARLFADRGYHGVSIDDIGAAVGMSGPGIYRHFASKEDVLAQMLLRISQSLHDEGGRRVVAAPDGAAALDALLRWHVEFSLSQPTLITVHGRELGNVPAPARRQIRRLQRLYVEEWVTVLSEVLPGAPQARLRAAAHAAIGLLNSTPQVLGKSGTAELGTEAMADLLCMMARAALLAAGGPATELFATRRAAHLRTPVLVHSAPPQRHSGPTCPRQADLSPAKGVIRRLALPAGR